MEPDDKIDITLEVPRHLVAAFNETVREFFVKSHAGTTAAQRAAEVRARDKDAGLDSLVHLVNFADGNTGQCEIIARFLAGLYNGTAFPFDLTELRGLDPDLFEHCMSVLRLDNTPTVEIHKYFPDGKVRWTRMIKEWNLEKLPPAEPEPARGEWYNVRYVTHGNAPGYRDITLHVAFDKDPARLRPIELNFSADDSARIAKDILEIHRFTWLRERGPLDVKPGETRPAWI